MRSTLTRSITALILVIAMAVGMTASLGGKAQAATPINIAYAAGDDAKINGGPVYNVNAYVGVATTITTVKPTRSGCNFLGWTTTKNSGRIDFKSGQSVTFTKATTLWPVWNTNIAYAADDGKFSNGSPVMNVSVTLGNATTVPTSLPQKTGYTCIGWNTTKKSSTIQYKPGASITYDKQITFWPVWKVNTIKITYNINGGTWKNGDTAQSFTYGSSYTLTPPDCIKTGYTLAGWNTKADGSGTMYQKGQKNIGFSSNVTLYAIWAGRNCVITYYTNGGTVGTTGSAGMTQNFTVGKNVTLNPPSIYRTGYTLQGFSTNKNDTSAPFKTGNSYAFNSNTNLYAIWKKSPIQVKFDGNQGTFTKNGSSYTTITITGSDGYVRAIPSEIPHRTGYKFLGYSESKTAYSATYGRSGSINISTSQTVYAVWIPLIEHEGSRVAGLSRRDFVQVAEGKNSKGKPDYHYGANQSFPDYYTSQRVIDALSSHWFVTDAEAKDYLEHSTCGTFAAINTVKYLNGVQISDSVSIIETLINYYNKFVIPLSNTDDFRFIKINNHYLGELPTNIETYIKKNYDCSTSWKKDPNKPTLITDIKRMLWTDVPVIMFFQGGSQLPFKQLENHNYIGDENYGCKSHFFVVTALYVNSDDTNDVWLEISTWGEKAYFSLNNYYNNKSTSIINGHFGNGYILITPDGGLRTSAPPQFYESHTSDGGYTHSGASGHF